MNYVFYVSEMDELSSTSYSYKMENAIDIASQISQGLGNKCIVKKYTDYNGELLNCESVGIVFPSRRWGISIAVYSFLQNLRIAAGTYVYAVALEERLSGKICDKNIGANKALEQYRRALSKKFVCKNSDIYVRCMDRIRTTSDTEYNMRTAKSFEDDIRCILNGMLFYDLDDVKSLMPVEEKTNDYQIDAYEIVTYSSISRQATAIKNDAKRKISRLSNVFLDDSVFEGWGNCQVI